MDWSNEKIPQITKLLPPKLKVVRWSFLKNSVISKKTPQKACLSFTCLNFTKDGSWALQESFFNIFPSKSTCFQKHQLWSKGIYFKKLLLFCCFLCVQHHWTQTANCFFQPKRFYITNFGNKYMLQKLLHPMLSSKIWGTKYCNTCKNYTYDREIYR